MDDENELENQSIDIPIWKRYLLTVTEVAQFYHICEKRLRQSQPQFNRKFYNKCMRNEIKVSHALILF